MASRITSYNVCYTKLLREAVDALEEDVLVEQTHALTPRLAAMRRQAILLRRYLAPQREALARLQGEKVPGLSDLDP